MFFAAANELCRKNCSRHRPCKSTRAPCSTSLAVVPTTTAPTRIPRRCVSTVRNTYHGDVEGFPRFAQKLTQVSEKEKVEKQSLSLFMCARKNLAVRTNGTRLHAAPINAYTGIWCFSEKGLFCPSRCRVHGAVGLSQLFTFGAPFNGGPYSVAPRTQQFQIKALPFAMRCPLVRSSPVQNTLCLRKIEVLTALSTNPTGQSCGVQI